MPKVNIIGILFGLLLLGLFSTASASSVDDLLGTPYRPDGVINDRGDYATFNQPAQVLRNPGLNCSGLVVQIARQHATSSAIRLDQAGRDRHADSGQGSALGQDWDFGWDLIINLSQNTPQLPLQILPTGPESIPTTANGLTHRGFDFTDIAAWQQTLSHLVEGQLYLVSFSRQAQIAGYRVLHHHVAAIRPEKNHIWLYHATAEAGSHRLDLAKPEQLEQLIHRFSPPRGTTSHALVVESQYTD